VSDSETSSAPPPRIALSPSVRSARILRSVRFTNSKRTENPRDHMKNTIKTLIKISLAALGVVVVAAIAIAGYLIYPGTPSHASSLAFQGYVPLPSDRLLSVLDYLTVKDDKLFV